MPEIKEQESTNDKIQARLQDDIETRTDAAYEAAKQEVLTDKGRTQEIANAANKGDMGKVQKMLEEDISSVFPNNLDNEYGVYKSDIDPIVVPEKKQGLSSATITKGPVTDMKQIVDQHIKEEVAKKTRAPKQAAKVQSKVSAEEVVAKLKEQAEKATKLMELVEWADECVNTQDMPANLSKEHRELLLGYVKQLESAKSTVLDHISKL